MKNIVLDVNTEGMTVFGAQVPGGVIITHQKQDFSLRLREDEYSERFFNISSSSVFLEGLTIKDRSLMEGDKVFPLVFEELDRSPEPVPYEGEQFCYALETPIGVIVTIEERKQIQIDFNKPKYIHFISISSALVPNVRIEGKKLVPIQPTT